MMYKKSGLSYKTAFIFMFLVCFVLKTFAQSSTTDLTAIAKAQFQAKQVIPPSPIAAELGRYGNVPISLFTGTPNISVPLFELKGNSLSLPISLSYNASGFKPEDQATWVGSGWSLNGGGVVTRAVKGNPDNSSNYFTTTNPLLGLLQNLTPKVFPYYDVMHNIQQGLIETQPDIYYYNLGQYSGKFLLGPDQSIVKKKMDMVKITPNILSGTGSFSMQDEHGNIYDFTDAETTRTQPNDEAGAANGNAYNYTSSWFLTSIQTADGAERMDFEYYSPTTEQVMYPNNSPNQSYYRREGISSVGGTGVSCTNPVTYGGYNTVSPTSYIKRKFLKSIILSRNGNTVASVSLVSSLGNRLDTDFGDDRRLDQVQIFDDNIKLVKKYTLNYSYFGTHNRLRLDSVKEMPIDLTTPAKPAYQFTYNGGDNVDRFTKSIDHWGFYNSSGNGSLIPTVHVNDQVFGSLYIGLGANRDANIEGSSSTLLNKMQYPTGGYTSFEYELNQAINGEAITNVGGVRISKIVDYSAATQAATVKTYNYVDDNGISTGVATFPEYLTKTNNYDYKYGGFCTYCGPCDYVTEHDDITYTIASNSIYGLGSVQGSHIGYSQVTETQTDATNNATLGKTVYKYYIGPSSENEDDIKSGNLLDQSVYDSNGKLIKEISNTYTSGTTGQINGYLVKPEVIQKTGMNIYLLADSTYYTELYYLSPPSDAVQQRPYINQLYIEQYGIGGQVSNLAQKTEKTYDQLTDSYKTQTENYIYDNPNHIYPTQIKQSTTGNTELVTVKKYTGDYTFSGTTTDPAASAIVAMKSNNIQGTEIESLQFRQKTDGTNKRYLTGSITTYHPLIPSGGPLVPGVLPTPDTVRRIETMIPLTTIMPSDIDGSGRFTFDTHYKIAGSYRFDSGNLIQQAKTSGVVTSYIWDQSQTNPIASVVNATADNIAYTSFESGTGNNNWIMHQVLRDSTEAFTGKNSGIISGHIDRTFTAAAVQSVVSYWGKSAITVTAGGSTVVPVSFTGITVRGWTYYEHLLPTGTTQLTLTGDGIKIDELRLYPKDSQMQTQTYNNLVGITAQVSPANQVQYYEYDGLKRLVNIKDVYGNLKQNYIYNYGPGIAVTTASATLFYSAYKSQTFTKTGCPTDSYPTTETYVVPYGKYSASTQAAANALAQADIDANGQNYAQTHGKCLYYSSQDYSGRYFKNNCAESQGTGNAVIYRVLAGSVSSEISIADANTKAQAKVTANGQAYANENGTCSCGGVNQKVVNGTCETGTKIYVSSTPADGHYNCVYHYVFSDGSTSISYTETSSSNCVNN